MNKELTPLKALENIKHYDSRVGLHESDYDIIETALKRLELYESNQIFIKRANKLKALEIIKEHPEQLLDILETDNYNEYLDLDYAPSQYITEKEYELLKEVLL